MQMKVSSLDITKCIVIPYFSFFDDIWISILSCLFFQATWHACTKQEIRLLVSSSVVIHLQETWCLFNSVCLLTGKMCMCNLVSHYIHLPPHTWRWVKTLVAGYMMSWTNTFHFFKVKYVDLFSLNRDFTVLSRELQFWIRICNV